MPPAQPVFMRTKSGTKVYLTDNTVSMIEQKRALSTFIQIYNKSFTVEEQKKIGNIIYNYDKHSDKHLESDAYSATNIVTSRSVIQKLNPHKNKMGLITFSKNSYNDEFSIIHEMIHVKKLIEGVPYKKQITKTNERLQDFETVGRISKNGLKQHIKNPIGYYYTYDKKILKRQSPPNKLKSIASAILQDRKLLTGSLNTNITGKVASTRAKNLFTKSFFGEK